MRYTVYGLDGDCTAVSAPDMQCAMALYLAVHPTDDYTCIRRTRDDDDIRDNIVYMPPSRDAHNDTGTN